MGHDLGVSHGVALWQWQKQSHAGKSQAQRVEQLDGPRVRGQRRPSLAFPIAILRVWDRHQRAGTGSGVKSRPYFRPPTHARAEHVTVVPCNT